MTAVSTTASLFEYDLEACGGTGEVAGADEAGRGCLAGPLVAAAVVFDYGGIGLQHFELLSGLDDSKKLTVKMRGRLYPLIIRCAARLSVVAASAATIDERGLHKTNLAALGAAAEAVAPVHGEVLIDGYGLGDGAVPHLPVKKGDSTSAAIAAASIIAKVTRDLIMHQMHEVFPQYGFASHVGYATEAHRSAIARHGLSPLHRRSFRTGPLPAV